MSKGGLEGGEGEGGGGEEGGESLDCFLRQGGREEGRESERGRREMGG